MQNSQIKRPEQFIFFTPKAIDFKVQPLVINLHLETNFSTDYSEKPVLAICSQPPQTICIEEFTQMLHFKHNTHTQNQKKTKHTQKKIRNKKR